MVVRRSSTRVAAKRVPVAVPDSSAVSTSGSGDQVDVSADDGYQASVNSVVATKDAENQEQVDVAQNQSTTITPEAVQLDELPSTSSMCLDNIVIDDSFLAMIPESVLMDVEASMAKEASAAIIQSSSSTVDEPSTRNQASTEPSTSEPESAVLTCPDQKESANVPESKGKNKITSLAPSSTPVSVSESRTITPTATPVTPASGTEASTPASNISTRSRRERKVPIRFIEQMEQELDKPKRGRGQAKQAAAETPKKEVVKETPKKKEASSMRMATDKKAETKDTPAKKIDKKEDDLDENVELEEKKVIVKTNEVPETVTLCVVTKHLEPTSESESASESGSPKKALTSGTTTVETPAAELVSVETNDAKPSGPSAPEPEATLNTATEEDALNEKIVPQKLDKNQVESSDGSSDDSDNESDEENSDDDEEDPNKEYCICRKPHANRFMIACDGCEDWFHGSCVNVSRKAAEHIDAWLCSLCRETRPELAAKIPPLGKRKSSEGDASNERRKRPSGDDANKGKNESIRTKKFKRKIEESKELSEEEMKAKKLRQLIKKKKLENEEKLKNNSKGSGGNKLFAVPEKKEQKLSKCSVCKATRVKKEGTIYCSLDCIRDHIRVFRKKALKALQPTQEVKVKEVKQEESAVKSEEVLIKGQSTPESTDLKTDHAEPQTVPSLGEKSAIEPSLIEAQIISGADIDSVISDVKTDAEEQLKDTPNEVTKSEPQVTTDVKGDIKPITIEDKKVPALKAEENTVDLAVYDAFDEKDTNPDKDSKGNNRKKFHGKELLQFILRHPNYCLDRRLKVTPIKLVVAKVENKIKQQPEISKQSKASRSNSIQSNDSGKNEKKKVTEIQPSRPRKNSESKTPDSKSPTKLSRSNSKSSAKPQSDEEFVKQLRSKVEEMISSTLKSRINTDTLVEKQSNSGDLKKKLEFEAKTLSNDIELQLFKLCSNGSKTDLNESGRKAYNQKSRTLIFNLKNTKNEFLFHSLFADLVALSNKQLKTDQQLSSPNQNNDETPKGEETERNIVEKKLELIKPSDLVRMSSEELAKGTELDAWRKFEQKKSLEEVIKIEEEKTVIKKTKKGEEEIVSKPGMTDTPTSDMRSKSPPVIVQRSPEKVINPLDLILKDIDSINSKRRMDKIEDDVPKSPPRSPTHFTSQDAKFKSRSGHGSQKRSRSSTGPKIVTITPSLPSNMIIKESASGGVQIKVLDDQPTDDASARRSSPGGHVSQLHWSGTCSGFDETASSLDPGNSKFSLTVSSSVNANEGSIVSLMKGEGKSFLPFNQLNVIGRIAPEQVASYVDKLVSLRDDSPADLSFSLNQLVQLIPLELKTDTANPTYGNEHIVNHDNYTKFIKYLMERKRLAVIEVKNKSSKSSTIKDLYLMPYDPHLDKDQVPSPLNQIKLSPINPGDREKKLLLVIVRKAPLSEFSSSKSSGTQISSSSGNKRSRDGHREHGNESRKKSRATPPEDEGGFTPPRDSGNSRRKSSTRALGSFTPPRNDHRSTMYGGQSNASFDPSFSSNKAPVTDLEDEEEGYDPGEPDEEFIKSYLPGLSPDINDPPPATKSRSRASTDHKPISSLDARLSASSITDVVLNKILSHKPSPSSNYTPPPQASSSSSRSRGNNQSGPAVPLDENELMERARMQMKLLSSNHR